MNHIKGIINNTIILTAFVIPIIIEDSQFLNLFGCIYIESSNEVNISQSVFVASHIEVSVYIVSTDNIFIDSASISSCVSSTSPSQTGDVLSILSSRFLSVKTSSLISCSSTLTEYPTGYIDFFSGALFEYTDNNCSYNYGRYMAGNKIHSSSIILKHCYTGHLKCGVATIQVTFTGEHLIKELVIESIQSLDQSTIGFYSCANPFSVTIYDCIFWDIKLKYELASSRGPLIAVGCSFSSESPCVGDRVDISANSNIFGIQMLKKDTLLCYKKSISGVKICWPSSHIMVAFCVGFILV